MNLLGRIRAFNISEKISIVALFFCVLLQALEIVLGKLSAQNAVHVFSVDVYLCVCMFVLFTRAILYQIVLKKLPLSTAYSFMAVIPLVVLCISYVLFHENVSFWNVVGAVIIVVGLILMSKSQKTVAKDVL